VRIERVKCRIECGITRTDILQGPGMGRRWVGREDRAQARHGRGPEGSEPEP